MQKKPIKLYSIIQLSKVRTLILIIGSIVLSASYLAFILITYQLGISSYKTNGIATLAFIVSYYIFFTIVRTVKTGFYRANKKYILNSSLIFVPFILTGIVYYFTKNTIATLTVFIIGQITYYFYYNYFSPVPAYKIAYKLFQKQEFEKAKALLTQILEKHPDNYESLILLGVIHIKYLEYPQAIQYLDKAKEINPGDPICYVNLTNVYTATENFDQAIEYAKKTIAILPGNWNAYYSIALCSLLKKDFNTAIDCYNEVLKFDLPKTQVFLIHYGLAKSYNGIKNTDKGKLELDKTLQMANDTVLTYWQTQLGFLENFTNKPSLFVKEAVEYVLKQK